LQTNWSNEHLAALAHLIVEVPRPQDSEVTFSVFESSCHLLLTTGTTVV